MKTRNREAGQAVILFAVLCMTLLLGFAGLATDVGVLFRDKRLIQTAADSAAIAAASEIFYPSDPSADCTGNTGTASGAVCAAAMDDSAKNGLSQGINGTTIVVNKPPGSGPHSGDSNYVEVLVTQSEPTIFLGLFGFNPMPVNARAVAHLSTGVTQGCVYTLDTGGNGITIKGGGAVTVPNCTIYDDSSISTNGASGSVTSNGTGAVGSKSGNASFTPAVQKIGAFTDPLAFLPATVPSGTPIGANRSGNCSGGGASASSGALAPGYYCGITGPATLSTGLYVIDKLGLSVGGSSTISGPNVTGAAGNGGVTLYFLNGGSVSVSGNGTLAVGAEDCTATLADPSTQLCPDNTYNKVVIFEDRNDTAGGSIGGSAGTTLSGIIYMPDADLSLYGGQTQPLKVGVVVDTLSFNGSVSLVGLPLSAGISPTSVPTLAE